jgi:hypothetical protein
MRRSNPDCGDTPLARSRRRLGLERNELRRRVDRVQRAIALGLLVLLLGVAPPLAAWAASSSYESGMRAEAAERAGRSQVVATVTSAGAGPSGDRYIHETVQATWQGADGEPRTGTLPGWQNATVGAQRKIWVDREGAPAVPPRPHSRTVTDAAYAGVATVLGCCVPVLVAYVLVRRRCDRHRYAMWEADWARMDADANPRS